MPAHDCTTCPDCNYCGPDAEGTAPTPEPADPGTLGDAHDTCPPCCYQPQDYVRVPDGGEFLVRDGKVTRVGVDEIHGGLVYCYGVFE